MVIASGKVNGRDTLFIGLSFGNLKRFKLQPLGGGVTIARDETGLSHDILIMSGKTEQEIEAFLREQSATMQ